MWRHPNRLVNFVDNIPGHFGGKSNSLPSLILCTCVISRRLLHVHFSVDRMAVFATFISRLFLTFNSISNKYCALGCQITTVSICKFNEYHFLLFLFSCSIKAWIYAQFNLGSLNWVGVLKTFVRKATCFCLWYQITKPKKRGNIQQECVDQKISEIFLISPSKLRNRH